MPRPVSASELTALERYVLNVALEIFPPQRRHLSHAWHASGFPHYPNYRKKRR